MKSAGYPGYVTFKHKRNLLKRDITMVDRANHVAMVKLWGVHARINVSNNPVLVMRGAKVSEYGGTSLELFWYNVWKNIFHLIF